MKFQSLILAFFICGSVYAQSWIASNTITSPQDIIEIQSVQTPLGNILVFGFFSENLKVHSGELLTAYGERDYFLAKFNKTGQVEWLDHLGTQSSDSLTGGVCALDDGSVYVIGSFLEYLKYSPVDSLHSTGSYDSFLAKYTPDGNIVWCKEFATGPGLQISDIVKIDLAGDLIISGYFSDSIYFNGSNKFHNENAVLDYYYGKFDTSNTEPVWIQQIRGISGTGSITSLSVWDDHLLFCGTFTDSVRFDNNTLISWDHSPDVHFFKTDLLGNPQWIRKISGEKEEYSCSITEDADQNIYIGGSYNSPCICFDVDGEETFTINYNGGSYDMFAAKYTPDGTLEWPRISGSNGTDKICDIGYFNDQLKVGGHFSKYIKWGVSELTTNGTYDQDMFYGSLDNEGTYLSASNFSGRSNSSEETCAVFHDQDNFSMILRSNSDLLVFGDDIYTSTSGKYYIALGIKGCLPIIFDDITKTNIACYGDSAGIISILASGGFGSPYSYSIDNGETFQPNNGNFLNRPAGDYNIVVLDKQNCAEAYEGNPISLLQPNPLMITDVDSVNVTTQGGNDGSISVTVSGGTLPYSYVLNDGASQGTGNFTGLTAGKYLVKVDDANNCGPVETDSITITQPSSVVNLKSNRLKLYPNPSNGTFTMEIMQLEEELRVEIYNMSGTRVYLNEFPAHAGAFKETLDLGSYGKGIYLLKLNGEAVATRLVVQ